jgi:hypothetical protein
MTALLRAELLKLRTTRTFAAIAGAASALSLLLIVVAAGFGHGNDPHGLFANTGIVFFIVLLGAVATTGEWRHRTITSTVLAAPDRVRLLAAKALAFSAAASCSRSS